MGMFYDGIQGDFADFYKLFTICNILCRLFFRFVPRKLYIIVTIVKSCGKWNPHGKRVFNTFHRVFHRESGKLRGKPERYVKLQTNITECISWSCWKSMNKMHKIWISMRLRRGTWKAWQWKTKKIAENSGKLRVLVAKCRQNMV